MAVNSVSRVPGGTVVDQFGVHVGCSLLGEAALECGGVWSEAGVWTQSGPDGPPSSAYRKYEVTFSGFDFVGIWLREHLEFQSGRALRIASHEFTVLCIVGAVEQFWTDYTKIPTWFHEAFVS